MNLLIIGGTKFVGPALVDAALSRGHRVTLFNRGLTADESMPGVETIIGDRETDLDRLAGRRWDAVIDTCGYVPRVAALSAEALRAAVDLYVFISSLSVYPPAGAPERDESAEVLTLREPRGARGHRRDLRSLESRLRAGGRGALARAQRADPLRLDRGTARPDQSLYVLGDTDGAGWRRRSPRQPSSPCNSSTRAIWLTS